MEAVESFRLTERERELFALLLDFIKDTSKRVVMRAAGGWVRDKLMSLESSDIDIALDTLTGRAFAEGLSDWLQSKGKQNKTLGIIPRNPERSKHLETATMTILGYSLDFTNLRTESYADTRIPTISIGTPVEDALRRDFTVNSLFFNIHTSKIEDFTGSGMQDLKSKLIRTPMAPKKTLLDDPLRALRAVRFASRFDFDMHDELITACGDREVLEALQLKVSRERVGTEVDKTLSKGNPTQACRLIAKCRLADAIFTIPLKEGDTITRGKCDPCAVPKEWAAVGLSTAVAFNTLLKTDVFKEFTLLQKDIFGGDKALRAPFYLAAILAPLNGLHHQPKKSRASSLASHVVLESLKLPRRDSSIVEKVHSCASSVALAMTTSAPSDVPQTSRGSSPSSPLSEGGKPIKYIKVAAATKEEKERCGDRRVLIGRILREAGSVDVWQAGIVLAAARKLCLSVLDVTQTSPSQSEEEKGVTTQHEVQGEFTNFLREVKTLEIEKFALTIEPIFKGNELQSLLPKLKSGPEVKKILEAQLDWTIRNFPLAEESECRKFLQNEFKDLL